MLALCAVARAAPHSSLMLPKLPAQPPPRISDGPFLGSGTVVEYDLPAGWNVISFPLARFEGAEGFPRAIMRWTSKGYVTVDPIRAPRTVDTSYAYLTWVDAPTSVRVRGAVAPLPATIALHAGWNVIGCPSGSPIPVRQITLTREGGVTRPMADVASASATPASAWVCRRAHISPVGRNQWIDLRDPQARLMPGEDTWVFAFTPCTLNWNQAERAMRPRITTVSPQRAYASATVDIRGTGFGSRGDGMVTLSGLELEAADVISWSDTDVRVKLPAHARSGPLLVLVNRFPSNSVALDIAPSDFGGTLEGRVESAGGRPIAMAEIMLDNGQSTRSQPDGSFRIEDVPAGSYGAFIRREGYAAGKGTVRVEAGATRRLLVSLTPRGGTPEPSAAELTGTLWVEAYRYVRGEVTWFVRRIEVWEYGDHRKTWATPSWSTEAQSRSLQCTRAALERSYAIRVVWQNAAGSETSTQVYRKLTGSSQTFRIYAP